MISYKPFFETLAKKNISEYELIFKQGISANTIHRIKKGEAITTKTLDTLCFILDCSVSEILEHDKTKWQFFFLDKKGGAGHYILLPSFIRNKTGWLCYFWVRMVLTLLHAP